MPKLSEISDYTVEKPKLKLSQLSGGFSIEPKDDQGIKDFQENLSTGENILRGVGEGARRVMDFPGSLARTMGAHIYSQVAGDKDINKPGDWAEAFKGNAPTTSQYLERGGMQPGPLRSVTGLMGDIASDPLTYVGGAVKEGEGMLKAADIGLNPISKAASSNAGRTGLAKVGELFTGVPEQEIKTYSKYADEIKKMAKSSDNSTAEAADQIRSGFANDIDSTRKSLNDQISKSLSGSNKSIDAKKIIDSLEKSKAKIDTDFYPEQVGQVDDLINTVKKISDDSGNIPIEKAHGLKRYLQKEATSAYRFPGQSKIGTEAANSAKSGAAVARNLINEVEPVVAEANNKLADLHDLEDNMNLNMIREGKPESALLAAGSGGNPRNAKSLKELGQLTGKDMLSEAEKLAAMRTFGSPKLMAADTTGKSAGRTALGTGLGYLLGNVPGAIIGGAMTSPMSLRTAIDSGGLLKGALDPAARRGLINYLKLNDNK